MADFESGSAVAGNELRERASQPPPMTHQRNSSQDVRAKVLELNAAEDTKGDYNKDKRTYGRTPDGVVFTVPQTHDMVSQLLSPKQSKNKSDLAVLLILATMILTLYWLPSKLRIPAFAVIFMFWRASYNAGIGYLLQIQSNDRRLVTWARKSQIFEHPSTGKNPHPKLYALLKSEMETKIPKDYNFDEAPIEYNTWLVFRRFVDLILMCDFVSYCLFALACATRPADEGVAMGIARWTAGIILFLFNLWVKLDAHRVVKDYAWYWGDFFYLIDQDLTFDGVFEMAPHPMYSVGYAGYYGISLMAASYKVLFISILAHAAQFAFLTLVENPHIEKTYNTPPPRKRHTVDVQTHEERPSSSQSNQGFTDNYPSIESVTQPSQIHKIIGIQNIDFHRLIDIVVVLFQFYLFSFAIMTPSTRLYQAFFVANAVVWRLWYSVGIGYILDRQSNKKKWTRHFIKYGDSSGEAWRQWKSLYHLSMTLCHASFLCAAWKMYALPPNWEYGMALLRHIIGAAMVALQLWTIISIYESLGEFGWFFGDFFFDQSPSKLTYSGIYRFLNNPERILGLAGVWGIAIITWSKTIFFLALLSHSLSLAFIQLVERPHMQKLYGQSLRQESGLSKSIDRSLPSPIRHWRGGVDRVLGEAVEFVEELLDSARPKLAAGVGTFVKDSTALFRSYPARISITRLAENLAGFDPKDYSIKIEGTPVSGLVEKDKSSGRESELARAPAVRTSEFRTLTYEYGAPIKVRWTAPLNHSKKDWVGLYMVADNASRDVTRVASNGRWVATNPNVYDSARPAQGILVSDKMIVGGERADGEISNHFSGEMVFSGDKIWWTTGVFEFRYHHDGKHNVMAISLPFEIRIPRFDEEDAEVDANGLIRTAVETTLLPVVQNCFDRDPEIAPSSVDESFGSLVERDGKYAKRVVFAVHQMFGIELAPEVVQADGTVKNLAWRICNAKKVLQPYSMSPSKGRNTPTGSGY